MHNTNKNSSPQVKCESNDAPLIWNAACININIKLALATKSKYKLPPGGNYNGVPAVYLYDGRRPNIKAEFSKAI